MGRWTLGLAAVLMWAATGCASSSFLTRAQATDAPWKHYADVKAVFDGIVPGRTTTDELVAMGLSPDRSRGSERVTFVEVHRRFVPHEGITIEAADPGVQRCVQIRERCEVWQIELQRRRKRRVGNFLLDWTLFRRLTRITGWRFEALVLFEEGRVLYTLWSGQPAVLVTRDRVQPLGLFQEPFALYTGAREQGRKPGDLP